MISKKLTLSGVFFAAICLVACDVQAKEPSILVGSIPGDAVAKRMLAIDGSENVDFIRLRIILNEGDRKFDMNAGYGIGKPNTRDFENGGKSFSVRGVLEIKERDNHLIYRLVNVEADVDLSLMKINDQLFHVQARDGRLLAGNGGWNYTLSMEGEKKQISDELPNERKIDVSKDPVTMIFSGRTPCAEITRELNIAFGEECFKLKWKLTLHRDPQTGTPSTFLLQRTFRRSEPLEGNWEIVKNAGSVIYRLAANDGSKMSFLRMDDSLFFLDKAGRLLKGNGDFGYTLDRQHPGKTANERRAKMD